MTDRIQPAQSRSGLIAWCLYDWANSAYPTVITTFIFAAYFAQSVASSPVEGTVLWSRALTVAGLIVAFASPVLGAIADILGPRKPWLLIFSTICIVATALLWFVKPDPSFIPLALFLYVFASTAYHFAIVFYDAMLSSIAPAQFVGRVSGWGWATGYAGGLVCLTICLWLVLSGGPRLLGLDASAAEPVRATTIFAALWFALFSLPILLVTPDRPATGIGLLQATRSGFKRLPDLIELLRRNPPISRFLFAHMAYTDGLVTLFAFGGIYAAAEFGMKPSEILVFGIVLNVAAGAGAAAFAWLDDIIGPKKTIIIALCGLLIAGAGIVLVRTHSSFWAFATILGLFVGPAQAAGRSMMVRLAPAGTETEMFGLYALAGKATAFAGPLTLGLAVQWTGSQRAGIATILVYLLLGLSLLVFVTEPGSDTDKATPGMDSTGVNN